MPITREEVYWLYRVIFDREPESEDAFDLHTAVHSNFAYARQAFLKSREFQDQILPPVYYQKQPFEADTFVKPCGLALAAIVKDEEKHIELMLRSCSPIISFATILDTGSSDRTKELAATVLESEGIPYQISDAPFINFSQARNCALGLVPADMRWVLMLDADEHLVPEDYSLFSDLTNTDVEAWGLPRYSFTDEHKLAPVQSYPDHQRRLLRNQARNPIKFSGTVHEDIVGEYNVRNAPANTARFAGSTGGPHIHHMGAIGISPERLREKLDLYINLSLK